jgi:hypothetical protein
MGLQGNISDASAVIDWMYKQPQVAMASVRMYGFSQPLTVTTSRCHSLMCYELIVIYRWNVGEAPSKGTLIVGSTSICSKVRHQVFTRVGSSSSFCR